MRHPIELAAGFFRRGEFVLGNDVLNDEYDIEYKNPGQVEYYAVYRDDLDAKAINKALRDIAEMCGCLTYLESGTSICRLVVVGEEGAVNRVKYAWRIAMSDEYGYKAYINQHLNDVRFHDEKHYKKWVADYIEGFFEGLVTGPQRVHGELLRDHPRMVGLRDGLSAYMKQYEE